MDDNKFQMVICSCPDKDTANSIAENIVAQRLAACVNVLPMVESIYHWQGAIESAQESLLMIKTRKDKFLSLQATICSMHPYEVPEIIALDIEQGFPDYLHWISQCLTSNH